MKAKTKSSLWGYLFITPQFLGIILFIIIPLGFSLYLCFSEWNFIDPPKWIGIGNIVKVLQNELTLIVFRNTFILALVHIPLTLTISLLLAIALTKKITGAVAYRTFLFMPCITSSVAVALVWTFIYDNDYGMINNFLRIINIKGPPWINSMDWALPSVIILTVWRGVGYYMVIFLAGLKAIPKNYYEAATIDGVTDIQKFMYITLPLLTPTIFFQLVVMFINLFKIFNEPYIMTGGGPGDATNVVVLRIYKLAFQFWRMGEASVVAFMLFLVVLAVTMFQFRFSKWVIYDV